MKLLKIFLLVAAIPALSASVYAGGCCKGGDKDGKAEKASVENVQALGGCCKGGDKDGKKEKASVREARSLGSCCKGGDKDDSKKS